MTFVSRIRWSVPAVALVAAAGLAQPRAEPATSRPVPAQPSATGPSEAAFGRYHPALAYEGIATTSFYLPMRDGTRIAMQVSRPAKGGKAIDGRFPVIWEASIALPPVPTGKAADNPTIGFSDWSRLVRAGYVIVTVARRGNGQSMGSVRSYNDRQEAYDAYEITEWLARQPWSDGKIGMHGCSNTGEAVMHALTVPAPHLKAAWAGCFSWSKYDGFLRGGGIIANWGSGPQRTFAQDMAQRPVDGDADKTLLRQAATDHQRNSNLADLLASVPFRDSWAPLSRSTFMSESSIGTYMGQLRQGAVPLTIQGGWFDDFRAQGLIAFANLPNTRVLIGPWLHCRQDGFDLIGEAQRFFDYHLKGIDTGIAGEAPIHYFVSGASVADGWRSATGWPLADMRDTTLFLAGDRLDERPRRAAARRFTVDPAPACAPANSPVFDQPCHRATGTLAFTGRPVTQAMEVIGHPVASVWITANTPDVNVFAYLEDVAPDGKVTTITEGRLKASLRKTAVAPWNMIGLPWHRSYAEDAAPLQPGQPAQLTFDLLPTAYRILPGHRVQLTVSGSDHREKVRAQGAPPEIMVLSDPAHPSSIRLPVKPAMAAPLAQAGRAGARG